MVMLEEDTSGAVMSGAPMLGDARLLLFDKINELLGNSTAIIFVPRRIGTTTLLKEIAGEHESTIYCKTMIYGTPFPGVYETLFKNGTSIIVACGGTELPFDHSDMSTTHILWDDQDNVWVSDLSA